ncbi:tol-pal system protein YbgF [Kineobactrum salinum]|uniref:Cell division coordinator CpoB n=1 Tax=Kineobactrum salinum TaxID=2708301 RepID=A0A6C0U0S5_9GAMM|nr:tol-pal system protein YbgF [Kineobactrum salinum]QIB65169.1 tol-pal system protein YbgF [Kineobactrum salinum]
MRRFSKALLVNGLALAVGPLCVVAQAQDYIDVEAERAAREAAAAAPRSLDPDDARSTQSYPATSYGIGNAPAAPLAQTGEPSSPPSGGSSSGVGQLLFKVQQLEQEVRRLNGIVEEQAHELRTLKDQSLERYLDLDRRVSMLSGGTPDGGLLPDPSAADSGSGGVSPGPAAEPGSASRPPPAASTGSNPAVEQPGEAQAYQSAYALVRGQQFSQAVTAFQQFLRDYPAGRFAPNAHYWLGELYLVADPPDPEAARQAFTLLLDLYPNDSKVPDALFKLGRVHFMKGNRERAREFLDRVVRDYSGTNSAAVKLAQDFINENY